MVIITDNPNHASITGHESTGCVVRLNGKIDHFDSIQYFQENAEWPEHQGPFYYLIDNESNRRYGLQASDVRAIYFYEDTRIRGLEEI